ncbi:hypothetical protein IC582_003960 [Cucumis melo]
MEKSEIARPISTILDGSNYITWANQMKSFLIGRKLWRIVTGDITKLTKQDKEDDSKFIERLEEWDSKNHQIITWLSNTSIPVIHTQFDAFENAKELWNFLSTRFKSVGLTHYYQLHNSLVNLNQDAGQSVNEYLVVLQPIWTQLDQATISKDHLRLIKVLMGLRPEYESVRAALLHRSPLPSLDAAIQEILFEERRLGINLSKHSDDVLASTYSPPGASSTFCENCKLTGHKFINCPKIECRYCHKPGHILDNCPIKPPRPRNYSTKAKNFTKPSISSAAAVAPDNSTFALTMPWSIKTPLFYLFSPNRALLFSASALTLLNKMDVLSANIATFLTQFVPFFFLPHVLRNFGVKQLLHPSILSIVSLPPSFKTSLHSKDYMVLLLTIPTLKSLVVLVLFSCILMNTLNLNPVPASAVFLAMAQNIKVFVVGIPFLIDFVYLAMSFFGSTLCSLVYPPSTPPSLVLHLSSLTHLLIFFLSLSPLLIVSLITMFSRLSSFHASFSSPPSFFTDTSIDLFPLSESTPDNELDQSVPTSATSDQSSISDGNPDPPPDTPPRRSTRVRKSPIHLQDYRCFSTIVSLIEPTSYQEASTDPLWQKAMNDELQALERTHAWDYVNLPPGKRPIGCKWIYKIKTHSDGTIERYKARLVAKGYSKEYGIDYEETFAHVARMTSVRSLLVVVAAKQWPLLQMDVKNAFLNGTLFEEVYMKPPPGTSSPPHKVCLLRRALYGLKQAPRAWFATFSSTITQLGFTSSPHDTALFTRHTPQDWAGDPTDRRSTTGYCFYLGDSLISRRSKKQSVVSRSSTESEYRALVDATAELLWLRWLLADMGVPQQGPTLLHCDNRSVIQIAHNDVFHERTKHIENDCHFIRHHLLSHTLLLQSVSTTEQPVDIFTKALPSTRFNQIRTKLKLTATLPP